jgi:3-methylcrotonyl-CoA carboxylase alpha subunit
VLAALILHATTASSRSTSPWDALDGFIPNLPARISYNLTWHEWQHTAKLILARGCPVAVAIDAQAPVNITDLTISDENIAVSVENFRRQARYLREGPRIHLWTGGEHFELALDDPRLKEFSSTAAQGGLTTPLPGVVAAVAVQVGQPVQAGDLLMVIEAMKMEHSIRAPNRGVVKVIHFECGDRVPEGSELLELAPEPVT